jgi:hypothetical protein
VWILDMAGYTRANSPPISVSLATLRILADHCEHPSTGFRSSCVAALLRTCFCMHDCLFRSHLHSADVVNAMETTLQLLSRSVKGVLY